jgi:hypothetical protein
MVWENPAKRIDKACGAPVIQREDARGIVFGGNDRSGGLNPALLGQATRGLTTVDVDDSAVPERSAGGRPRRSAMP